MISFQNYPVEEVITAELVFTEYKPEAIQEVLDSLLPERTR
jgi:secreted Zn-dependent insulinase-like peptidase